MADKNTGVASRVRLYGFFTGILYVDHVAHGKKFYRATLAVMRLSGMVDFIPVTIPYDAISYSGMLSVDPITTPVRVDGEIRTYRVMIDGMKKRITTVYAHSITICKPEDEYNMVELHGTLRREPIYRQTPLGREITDLMIEVQRPHGKRDHIPCIVWGRKARYARHLHAGDKLTVKGRIQSRDYKKVLEDGSVEDRRTLEVSAYCLIDESGQNQKRENEREGGVGGEQKSAEKEA